MDKRHHPPLPPQKMVTSKSSRITEIRTVRQIKRVCAKNLEATLLFIDFSKAFDSIHRGKMEQILQVYGLPKETIPTMMMLNKNGKKSDVLAIYLFIIYALRMSIDIMKENGFTLKIG